MYTHSVAWQEGSITRAMTGTSSGREYPHTKGLDHSLMRFLNAGIVYQCMKPLYHLLIYNENSRVQRELTLGAVMVVRSLWTCWSLPWTSQDKSGHLDTQDGRCCAYALGRGSPHRCLLTLHNLTGDAGINDESKKKIKKMGHVSKAAGVY